MTARQTEQIRLHGDALRAGGEAEDVHRLRVAMRRLRATLRAARPVLDADWAETLRSDLRRFASALGPLRDLDVLIAHVATEPEDGGILPALRDRREREAVAAAAALADSTYGDLLDRLDAAAAGPRVVRDGDLPAAAVDEFRKLRRELKRAGDQPDDAALHGLRIRTKRARYAAELVGPAVGKRAVRFAEAAKRLQDVLGEHQDAVVAEQRLRELLPHARDVEAAFALGRLVERQHSRRAAARAEFPVAWADVVRRGKALRRYR